MNYLDTPDTLSPFDQALMYCLATRAMQSNELRLIHKEGYIKSFWGLIANQIDYEKLHRLNEQGFDIYGVVNQAKPETKERIETRNPQTNKLQLTRDQDIIDPATWLFCETDKPETREGDNLKEFLKDDMPPSMVVRSSYPNKLHVYWKTTGIPKKVFKSLCQAIINHFGASQESKNPARVLRIPGFIHTKSGLLVTLKHLSDAVYSYEELMAYFKPESPRSTPIWQIDVSKFSKTDADLIGRIKKACITVARNNVSEQFRHKMLYYAACTCRDHGIPKPQAEEVVTFMADILPDRAGQPVSHREALDSLEYAYQQPADFSNAWALTKKPSKTKARTAYTRYLAGVWRK